MIAPHIHTYCPHCSKTWTADEIVEQTCTDCPFPMGDADVFFTDHARRLSESDLVAMMLIEGLYSFDRPDAERGVARPDVEQEAAA